MTARTSLEHLAGWKRRTWRSAWCSRACLRCLRWRCRRTVNIKTTGGPTTSARGQDQSLAQLIQGGSLLPVISGESLEDLVLGGHDLLVGSYADHIGYPLGDRSELHKMVKYRSLTTNWKDRQVKQDYLDMVGNCVYALAGSQSVPADQIEEAVAEAAGLTLSQFLAGLSSDDGEHYYFDHAHLSIQAAGDTASSSTQPYVLIIDQFEEIIMTHLGRWQERGEFFANSTRSWRTILTCRWC